MVLKKFPDKKSLAAAAAARAGTIIRDSIAARGKARIIAATGASQFEFLEALTALPGHRLAARGNVPPRRIRGPARNAPSQLL